MRYLLTASLCTLFILFAFKPPVHFVIQGKVTDENGVPIVYASVLEKGTHNGTTTDTKGDFKLTVSSDKATLVISYLGYSLKEVKVSPQKNTITVSLSPGNQQLSEVVVTALGTRKEKKSLGFSSTISHNNQYGLYSPANPITGRVPGLDITGRKDLSGSIPSIQNKKYPKDEEDIDDFNREGYDAINENRFVKVSDNPLSTFSIDVDAASYSNIRRIVNMGQLPPAGAVRIEEMINYFTYDYPQPKNEEPFSINTEVAECPWNHKHKLVLVGLQGKEIPTKNLPPTNLVFLIDVSESMLDENKLPLVQQSLNLLTDQLRSQDKVAIVVYAGNAGLILPPTSGTDKRKIKEAIDQLEAGGSTAGGAGIQLAYKVAKEHFIEGGNNRVILCTDGDFNIGASSDDQLERMIEDERKSGVFLTVLGYGMGNYQDAKMQKLADKGNGNHAYIDNLSEARKVLVSEFGGTLFTIAKDVKLQIEFNPFHVQGYRLIGYENRLLNKEDFNNDKKDAGELGSGHTVTALYEVIPAGIETDFLGKVDKLKYQQQPTITSNNGAEIMTIKFRYKKPDQDKSLLIEHTVINNPVLFSATSDNFRFASAVAQFGMLLRNSEFKQNASFMKAWKTASSAIGKDTEGYRGEFLKIVKKAQSLAGNKSETEEDDEDISKR